MKKSGAHFQKMINLASTIQTMKFLFVIIISIAINHHIHAQKNMMIEKIGTHRKFYFKTGDDLKIRIKPVDSIIHGKIWDIRDSALSISKFGIHDVRIKNISVVYKHFSFPRKLAIKTAIFSGAIFCIIAANHLINNEPVFTKDMFIISGSFLGASLISWSFHQQKLKIGHRWKIKVLDINILR